MTVKILIVDDEPDLELLIRQRFRKQIRDKSYEFLFAHHGGEALEQLEKDPEVLLVLSDINMPVMDGLTLLGKLKELNPLIQPVIVSAYGDMTNIRTAMNRGAFDFLTKPIDFEDFETTIVKTLAQVEALQQAVQARARLAQMDGELRLASEIQQSILPHRFDPGPELKAAQVHALMIAARNVGGDFYDFFALDSHRLGVVIGDVSGKGMPAAIFMAMSRTLLKAVAKRAASAGACLTEVNDLLYKDNESGLFVTLFYAILDARTGEIEYGNGGHNPPYIVRAAGGTEQLDITQDTVMGVFDGHEYHTQRLQLLAGDALYIYTDGITEAMDGVRNMFGEKRLEAYLQQAGAADVAALAQGAVQAVRAFANGAPQSDDITSLAVRYRP